MKKIYFLLLISLLTFTGNAQTQNTFTEVMDYREVDGKIIVEMAINGVIADFILDLSGHTAILPEYLAKLNIDSNIEGNFGYSEFLYKKVPVTGTLKINTLSFGNAIFNSDMNTFVLKDAPYLRKLGVAGVIGSAFFAKSVLTIDAQRKKITITAPYRPSYMKLNYRMNIDLIRGGGILCPITIGGNNYNMLVDTWSDATIAMNDKDFKTLEASSCKAPMISMAYGENVVTTEAKKAKNIHFVKTDIKDATIVKDADLTYSVLGLGILKYGILSVDYVRQKVYFQPYGLAEIKEDVAPTVEIEAGKLNSITREYFLKYIFDYREGKDFIYTGDKPIVIDFWASWCGPCMRLFPEMEKMAAKYKDEIIFLKVNADKEKELCNIFNVNALPTLFFIPINGKPIIEVGAKPEKYIQIIENQLLNRKK